MADGLIRIVLLCDFADQSREMQAHPMDSPGLDDFAHMGLIDDLLTE